MTIRTVYSLIPKSKRKGAGAVLAGTVLLALLDFVGLAALVSVLLLVLDEQAIYTNRIMSSLYEGLGFTSPTSFVIAVCVAVLVIIALKSTFTLLVRNAINKYLLSLYSWYSTRMFDTYLSKGLLFIRQNHTARLINDVNMVSLRFAEGVVGQLIMIASEAILLVMILTAILIYDPLIVALAVAVFLPLALIYSRYFKKRMVENGKKENSLFVAQHKTMQETLRGYSDIEINNAKGYFSRKFGDGLKELTAYRVKAISVRLASSRVVEFSLVLGVVAMIIVGLSMGKPMASLKISLGVFALAAYKIVPSVSKIVNGWVEYKRNTFAAEQIMEIFADDAEAGFRPDTDIEHAPAGKLPFFESISIENVSFSYDDNKKILDDFSLTVRKGERIGIKGYSGVGKSTLFNILCGFFEPSSGRILVDGVPLTPGNKREWQNNIAYVSQDVFLPDITIAENIAFGMERSEIDGERLMRAIEAASLAEFVGSLPDGVDSVTGEAGCRISGGQRQRIGIARALYKQASVLLFDEATSSLDEKTEHDIVSAIEALSASDAGLTMLIISHREHTLRFCDRVIEIN